jgi:23S rRNA (cytosine1962-C5)-methyltransferase
MELSGFGKALEAAWQRRRALMGRTDAFRVLNGAASGTPGLIVDHFAGWLVAYAYAKESFLLRSGFAECLAEITGARGLGLIDRGAKDEAGREDGRVLFGEPPADAEVREGRLRFRVHPLHPRNVGLFLDTRRLRESLAAGCAGKDVLNLFAYSCSLGIAAAAGGAASVVNVDVSARYLGWGKDNLALNGLAAEGSRFTRMDSGKYLDWAAKKGLGFDVIILDPPSFARNSEGTFSFAKDYFRLAGACARRLRPGGTLYALTNFGGIAPAHFRARFEEVLRGEGRAPAAMERVALPEDFDGARPPAEAGGSPPGSGAGAAVEGTLLGFAARIAGTRSAGGTASPSEDGTASP